MPKNIYKKSGWYYARKTIKGVEHSRALETKSQGEAKVRAAAWLEELKATDWQKPVVTFNDAVNHFLEVHMPRLKANTRTRYTNSLLHFADRFEGVQLDKIGSAELSKFEADRRNTDKVANPTIIRDFSALSIMFEVAIEADMATANPVKPYLKKAKRRGLTESEPETRYLSYEEEGAVIRACRDMKRGTAHSRMMLGVFVVLAIDTGLRSDELLGLRWTDVDLDGSEVYVQPTRAKSKVGRRVPLLARARRLLAMVPKSNACPYVIFNRSGTRYDELYHLFICACAHVGITDASPHDLRRTCGVRLLRDHVDAVTGVRGMSMERVSKWLGHSSVRVTERHYAFLKADDLHEAVGSRARVGRTKETDLQLLIQMGDK